MSQKEVADEEPIKPHDNNIQQVIEYAFLV